MPALVPTLILGIVIVLTGMVHMLGGFRTNDLYRRKWAWEHFFLGLIEIGMGLFILVASIMTVQLFGLALSIGGVIAGIGLFSDAVRLLQKAGR